MNKDNVMLSAIFLFSSALVVLGALLYVKVKDLSENNPKYVALSNIIIGGVGVLISIAGFGYKAKTKKSHANFIIFAALVMAIAVASNVYAVMYVNFEQSASVLQKSALGISAGGAVILAGMFAYGLKLKKK